GHNTDDDRGRKQIWHVAVRGVLLRHGGGEPLSQRHSFRSGDTQAGAHQQPGAPERHSTQSRRHGMLHLHAESAADRRRQQLRPRRRDHLDGQYAAGRSAHETVSDRDESVAERIASQRVQRLGARERGYVQSSAALTGDRDRPASKQSMTPQPSIGSTFGHERGIALVLSLFLMMALSVVASSLMFLSQTETYC